LYYYRSGIDYIMPFTCMTNPYKILANPAVYENIISTTTAQGTHRRTRRADFARL
jgi:hypothetical protein